MDFDRNRTDLREIQERRTQANACGFPGGWGQERLVLELFARKNDFLKIILIICLFPDFYLCIPMILNSILNFRKLRKLVF